MDAPVNANAEAKKRLFSALACCPEDHIFVCDPNHVAFGAFCHTLAGQAPAMMDKFNALLNLPFVKDSVVQFINYASPDIQSVLERYAQLAARSTDPLLRDLTRERIQFLRQATTDPADSSSGTLLRDSVLLITAKIPIAKQDPTEEEWTRTKELRSAFMQTIKSIGIPHMPLTAERYKRFMQTVLNHGDQALWREASNVNWEPTVPLSEQLLEGDSAIEHDTRGIWLGGKRRVRVLTAKHRPEEMTFGSAVRYLGDVMSGNRGIRENVLMTVNVYYPDGESARGKVEADRLIAVKQAEGKMARLRPEFAQKRDSMNMISEYMGRGDRVVRSYLSVAVFSKDEDSSIAASTNVRTYFRELGMQLTEDHHATLMLFAQMLPFAAEAALAPLIQKYKTSATTHVLPFLPVFGSWRGTGTPVITLNARDGQLITVNPYDSESNYSACVAAQSGSGKSFLVQHFIERFRAIGARVWVIDVGGSYKQLNKLLKGYYLQFAPDRQICLNPFSRVKDFKEESDMLSGIIQIMMDESGELDAFQKAGLKKVMAEQFEVYGTRLTIDHLEKAFLAQEDNRLRDLGHQLFSWTSRGEYGRYFVGENNFDVDNPFIVIELEELKSRKHLQKVVLLAMISQINQQMYLGDRGQKKMLVIDECWDLLGTKETKDFIVAAYRRARKVNGSTFTITQSVSDYYLNEGTLAIVENSANMYLLAQKGQSIDLVKEKNRLPLDDFGYQMLKSVHTVRGEYSEVMCITDARGYGVGRLVVSEFQKKLYSTTPDEVAVIEQLQAQGMSLTEAIHHVIESEQRANGRRAA